MHALARRAAPLLRPRAALPRHTLAPPPQLPRAGLRQRPLWPAARGFATEEEKPADAEPAEPAKPAETVSGDSASFEFQAETKQLLDIVANSLYTDKEVFVRELISNSSDALNKLRSAQVAGEADGALPLEIDISTQPDDGTITITDTGVGMKKEELIQNLGTIARSGSRQFISEMEEEGEEASSIIGRFGVGFYSAFMVSAVPAPADPPGGRCRSPVITHVRS
jgi:hypothetical protein